MKNIALLALSFALTGCVSSEKVSVDSNQNYEMVFKNMRAPRPLVVNSRLEHYTKDFGLWKGHERNGEWEFEILAPKEWVDEVKTHYAPTTFEDPGRKPNTAWWTPNKENFDSYQLPYTSYPAAHLYVERNPKDTARIHVFVKRH